MRQLELLLKDQYYAHFVSRCALYNGLNEHGADNFDVCSPTRWLISEIYIAECKLAQQYFNECRNLIEIDMICCDHTFRSAAKVGYHHPITNRFVKQYSGLFICMNGKGQIIQWSLTKSVGFIDTRSHFIAIKDRLQLPLKLAIIDNCCHLSKMLKNVFGEQLEVKLDLFHAVRRFTTTLKKSNPSRNQLILDFKLVFRSRADIGHSRLQSTPSASTIEMNLDAFISRWENVEINGCRALQRNSLVALQNLRTHIKLGCLSSIPAYAGTNHNERLHRHINAHGIMGFTTNAISPQLANSALSRCFHRYNVKRERAANSYLAPVSTFSVPRCRKNGECQGICGGMHAVLCFYVLIIWVTTVLLYMVKSSHLSN